MSLWSVIPEEMEGERRVQTLGLTLDEHLEWTQPIPGIRLVTVIFPPGTCIYILI